MAVRRYDETESVASMRKVDREGDETYLGDAVVGISCKPQGTLQLDLRSLRPLRINDRENLIIELDLAEVLQTIAEDIRGAIKT